MKTVVYRGYTIKSFPQQHPTYDRWRISLDIFWVYDGMNMMRSLTTDSLYATEEDADLYGITYGEEVIDGKIDGLSLT